MKKGDWLFEAHDIGGDEINILMEIIYIDKDELEVMWYDTKESWPEIDKEVIARDEIERYLDTGDIVIINEIEAVKYLLAGIK